MITVLELTGCHFRLPDGFSGTLPEALRLLAEYVESERRPLPAMKYHGDDWLDFLQVNANGGRFMGTVGLNRLKTGELSLATTKDCAWDELPLLRTPDAPL